MIMLKKIHKSNYTMVELLLVIAVMALLLSIGVGGLNRVIRGTGATGGIRAAGNKLTLARTLAISSNQKVAVVFPGIVYNVVMPTGTNANNVDNDTLKNKYFFKSFRACIVSWNDSTGEYDFTRWCNGGEWSYLPNGTCANFISGTPAVVKIATGSDFDSAQSTANVRLPAIIFGASGSLDSSMNTNEMQFVVFEDTYSPSSNKFMINDITPSDSSGNTIAKGWRITINQFTGAITYDNYVHP